MPVLEALHLAKSYNQRRVVEDVSFSVKSGEVVGILGPNGCGKTTCFYMVEGLIEPDSGHIRLDGVELTHEPTYFRGRKGIGYLPQEASVFRSLSVEDNIMAILETRRGLDKNGRREALEKLLQEFNLGHLRKSRGISLSGGERRRVEVARALAAEPSFMLLDEPFSGIDPISVAALKHIVLQLKQRGIGVLITDHNVRDTLAICDKAYIVCEGRIIAEGNSARIVNDPFVREVYLGENFRL